MCARFALLGTALLSLGCNAIFDIHDGVEGTGGRGGSSSTATGGTGGRGSGGTSGAGAEPDGGEARTVSLRGTLRRFESNLPRTDAVKVTDYDGADNPTTTASETGEFTLNGVARAAHVELDLEIPQDENAVLPLALRSTRIALQSGSDRERTVELPVVDFPWLAQAASECGAFSGSISAQAYFQQRSTLIVEVYDEAGEPRAGVSRDAVEVRLTGRTGGARLNAHQSSDDPDVNPTFVCVLESGDGGGLVGGTRDSTTSLGAFAVFRVRNSTGTGEGEADVSIRGGSDPASQITLRQSGQIAVVRIGKDW